MTSFKITSLKNFMSRLLTSEIFDCFLLEEASITTYNTFLIDGRLHPDFFAGEDSSPETENILPYGFSRWKDMKAFCFNLIKGKQTPLHFKFVLQIMPEYLSGILSHGRLVLSDAPFTATQLKAFILTIKYEADSLTLVTGISTHTFVPDKEPERMWDAALKDFLLTQNIAFEEL